MPVVIILLLVVVIDPTQAPPSVFNVFFAINLLHYSGCVSNPLIRCYFRQDLSNAFKAAYVKVKHSCCSGPSV